MNGYYTRQQLHLVLSPKKRHRATVLLVAYTIVALYWVVMG